MECFCFHSMNWLCVIWALQIISFTRQERKSAIIFYCKSLLNFFSEMGEKREVWGKLYNEKISNFFLLDRNTRLLRQVVKLVETGELFIYGWGIILKRNLEMLDVRLWSGLMCVQICFRDRHVWSQQRIFGWKCVYCLWLSIQMEF
jgi:precorrin-6B methylase 1